MSLDLTIANLANGNGHASGDNLGLAVAQSGDNGSLDNSGSDNLAVGNLRDSVLTATWHSDDRNRLALLGPVLVVQVVEGARKAAVEGLGVAQGEHVVLTNGEAAGEESTGLSGLVELELVVRGDVANAILRILGRAILQSHDEDTSLATLRASLHVMLVLLSHEPIDQQDIRVRTSGMTLRFFSVILATVISKEPSKVPVQPAGAEPVGVSLSVIPWGTARARPKRVDEATMVVFMLNYYAANSETVWNTD